MKRAAPLVSYSSSDDSDSEYRTKPAKKRKLPALSATLAGPAHIDNPALHQGRIRTIPQVEGQYAAHIYASVVLDRGSSLFKLLCRIIASATRVAPTLHDFWSSPSSKERESELHISLSRPIYLRAHQREDLKRAAKQIAEKTLPFKASFAQITQLANDEGTRIFLALEIGAGHHELKSLADMLTPVLQAIRQQEFYTAPRFHASIGWALLDGGRSSPAQTILKTASESTASHPGPITSSNACASIVPSEFPTIAEFPPTMLPALNEQYASSLTSATVKSFDISEICVKIGKEVSRWCLNGV